MKRHIIIVLLCLFSICIFAKNAVYSVKSRTEVQVDNIPLGSSYEFEQTGTQKERMTAGTSTTLKLTNYENAHVQAISLSMKSNKSSGSGSLRVSVDGQDVWTIDNQPFNSNAWNGEYSTEYVEITKMFYVNRPLNGSTITIYIESTENSLYVNQFTIVYTGESEENTQNQDDPDNPPSTTRHTVLLYTQLPDVDGFVAFVPDGGYVVMPAIDYKTDYWTFLGWSKQLFDSVTSTIGPIFVPGDTLLNIKEDITLYACYIHRPQSDTVVELQNGEYMLAFITTNYTNVLAYSTYIDNKLRFYQYNDIKEINTQESAYSFYIRMMSDSTLQILHNNQYIYANNSKKVTIGNYEYTWYYERFDSIKYYLYTYISGQKYNLNAGGGYDYNIPTLLLNQNYNSNYYWQFFSIIDYSTREYCSYPEGRPTAIGANSEEQLISIKGDIIMNDNQLRISVYTLGGICVLSTNSQEINLHDLPAGFYIINSDNRMSYKFIKR